MERLTGTLEPEIVTALNRLNTLCERLREAVNREVGIAGRVATTDPEKETPAVNCGTLHAAITEAEQLVGQLMRTQDFTLQYL